MGRRKIIIKQIPDVKLRHITFNKRKNGLFKKAAELSMLCNLNLLLVCEDGLGNLIQFSRNKINDVNDFLRQCNYQNIIDLTSDDYPDFSRINKKKDKDGGDSDSDGNDDYLPSEKETYTPAPAVPQNARNTRKLPMDQLNNFGEPPEKALKNKKAQKEPSYEEQLNAANEDAQKKKTKNKLGLRLNIAKGAEGAPEQQNPINEPQVKQQIPAAANPDQANFQFDRLRPKNEFVQQPQPSVDKRMDFTPNSFMPFMDPLKRLNSLYGDPSLASPFKFYAQQQARMESLNSVLKGMSPFTFPLGSVVNKPTLGEEENKLLESANAFRLMNNNGNNEAGSAHSRKVFTFQPEEGMPAGMNQINQMNQMNQLNQMNNMTNINNRNDLNSMVNQRALQTPGGQIPDYVNLPSVMKSEMDFDALNLPPDTLSARRFNFEGYFRDFDESAYNDLRKKYKMS